VEENVEVRPEVRRKNGRKLSFCKKLCYDSWVKLKRSFLTQILLVFTSFPIYQMYPFILIYVLCFTYCVLHMFV
jgi:hypothetical protein